ncbi:MAG TPA: hypothetical protein VGK10_11995 [Prolixibacteraceae bacterium]|jgi:hypothetical protein
MKNLNSLQFYKVAALMALLMIVVVSCKDDDPVLPAYAGTWAATESIPTETGYTSIKDIVTLTETSFAELGQMEIGTGNWKDIASLKGTMTVSGNSLHITLTDVGMTTLNMLTGLPTGTIITYHEGSAEFNDQLSQMEQPKTYVTQFSISGNQLTLLTDINLDGDYTDEYETGVYTRQ